MGVFSGHPPPLSWEQWARGIRGKSQSTGARSASSAAWTAHLPMTWNSSTAALPRLRPSFPVEEPGYRSFDRCYFGGGALCALGVGQDEIPSAGLELARSLARVKAESCAPFVPPDLCAARGADRPSGTSVRGFFCDLAREEEGEEGTDRPLARDATNGQRRASPADLEEIFEVVDEDLRPRSSEEAEMGEAQRVHRARATVHHHCALPLGLWYEAGAPRL